jgi:hypothetical protein
MYLRTEYKERARVRCTKIIIATHTPRARGATRTSHFHYAKPHSPVPTDGTRHQRTSHQPITAPTARRRPPSVAHRSLRSPSGTRLRRPPPAAPVSYPPCSRRRSPLHVLSPSSLPELPSSPSCTKARRSHFGGNVFLWCSPLPHPLTIPSLLHVSRLLDFCFVWFHSEPLMIELSFSTLENEIPLLPAQTLSFLVACGQENWNWVWWLESSACRIEDLGYCKKKSSFSPFWISCSYVWCVWLLLPLVVLVRTHKCGWHTCFMVLNISLNVVSRWFFRQFAISPVCPY